jgi:hypothetical protein
MPFIDLQRSAPPTGGAAPAPTGGAAPADGAADDGAGGGGGGQGAAPPAATAGPIAVLIGYLAVAAGALLGILLWRWNDPQPFTPAEGISVFAPLYIVTQAIERFIEPFSTYLGAAKPEGETKNIRQPEAMEAVYSAIKAGEPDVAAKRQWLVDRIRRNKAVIAWGLACFLGMTLCGLFGIFFLRLAGFAGVPEEIDIIVSGIAVGSGTKPLHDLISNMQKAKEQKDDPPEKKAA